MSKLVLAIDDDRLVHHIIDESLSEFCKLIHAKNGDEGIRQALKYHPDIILLDVEMPGLTGYEVCEKLKKCQQTADIPIMFLSSRVNLEERMRGYNAGASDYIMKPFNAEELKARIKVLYNYMQLSKRLSQDIKRAQLTAEIAMTDSGDMGRIMRFVGQSYHAHDLRTLVSYFFEFFQPFGLEVAVAFWYHNSNVFFAAEGAVQPIEQELMETHKDGNRFVDFGRRTIINYPKVSLLIKNMPIDDETLYGRYKDLFPHILEATNAKIKDMEVSEEALNKVEQIGIVFEELSEQLMGISEHQGQKLLALEAELAVLKGEIGIALSEQRVAELEKLYQHFAFLNDELSIIKFKLTEITDARHELIESLNKVAKPWGEEDVPAQTDIELF
ncbi:PleD family two-component system response regulator [Pseudoalteromonas fenneropenaei]|uniref:PleD family two-component system response regulator n=1 Tax=Pseudoalteromonas fenneropenaei TaxID=1737459 RepID=A0ABV7CPC0_9GAMM